MIASTILSFLGGKWFKGAIIAIAVAAVGYLYYDFISTKEELAVTQLQLKISEKQLAESIEDYDSLNEDLVDMQQKYDKLNDELFDSMSAICNRTDTVEILNNEVLLIEMPAETKSERVLEVERSLNKRLNNRNF